MKPTIQRRIFVVFNTLFLIAVMVVCLAPLVHLLAVSFSKNIFALAGEVAFWPRGFTLEAYKFLIVKSEFTTALLVSLERVVLGTVINMALVVLTAYPLSKETNSLKARTAYVWYFAVTMFFGGGLIPTYIVIKLTGLMNTIWSLIIPGALSVWNCVMLLNFFRGVPKELEEAARIDGASHLTTLIKIYLPLSMPALATILLFTVVGHWNSWFDGFIYLNSPKQYPLQTYLSTLVMQVTMVNKKFITKEDLIKLQDVSEKTLKVAQIFLGALPIMLVYPFLQKYFVKGIVVGSVKG
jgi:putative aldouronate transport system permease protein